MVGNILGSLLKKSLLAGLMITGALSIPYTVNAQTKRTDGVMARLTCYYTSNGSPIVFFDDYIDTQADNMNRIVVNFAVRSLTNGKVYVFNGTQCITEFDTSIMRGFEPVHQLRFNDK